MFRGVGNHRTTCMKRELGILEDVGVGYTINVERETSQRSFYRCMYSRCLGWLRRWRCYCGLIPASFIACRSGVMRPRGGLVRLSGTDQRERARHETGFDSPQAIVLYGVCSRDKCYSMYDSGLVAHGVQWIVRSRCDCKPTCTVVYVPANLQK